MGAASPRALAKSSSKSINARESPPPDTATAQGGPNAFLVARPTASLRWPGRCSRPAIAFAKSACSPPAGLFAAGGFAERRGAGKGLRRAIGIFRFDKAKRGAAFRFLAQRHEG